MARCEGPMSFEQRWKMRLHLSSNIDCREEREREIGYRRYPDDKRRRKWKIYNKKINNKARGTTRDQMFVFFFRNVQDYSLRWFNIYWCLRGLEFDEDMKWRAAEGMRRQRRSVSPEFSLYVFALSPSRRWERSKSGVRAKIPTAAAAIQAQTRRNIFINNSKN